MVISNSDSTNTLVSLDQHDGLKRFATGFPTAKTAANFITIEFRRTALQLPAEDDFSDDDDDDVSSAQQPQQPVVLYLPTKGSVMMSVDESLKCVPVLMDARDDLLSQTPVHYNTTTANCKQQQRILYVAQGEIAHCTPSQTDVLVSEKATTCHILALRSTSSSCDVEPLCTLTHLDDCSYSHCIRAAVQEHHMHHHANNTVDSIHLDLHVVGGYADNHGSSREISTWLLHLLADLADEYATKMTFTLRTACVTTMNSSTTTCASGGGPMARGLALHCDTGLVTTATCSSSVTGPAPLLRSARLWTRRNNNNKLYVIHSQHNNAITLQPFQFPLFSAGLESLLQLSDDNVLLQYCSTSPDCEDDEFVPQLRQTLHFLRDNANNNRMWFGPHGNRPLHYHRSSCLDNNNTWVLSTTPTM